ncbi:hypothetical protein LLH23_12675 [bacterium]|nr:hypothetical protein [bacterium]
MRCPMLLVALLVPALSLAQPPGQEALLDRTDNIAPWSLDPGREFPGADGKVSLATDAAGGSCVRLDYSFAGGGNYVTAARALTLPQASAVVFSIRQEGKNRGFVRVADASGQEHMGGCTAGADWHRVTLPLDEKGFPGHYGGQNDGRFAFPLKRIIIGVHKGASPTGAVFIKDLAFVTTDPGTHFGLRLSTPDPGHIAFVGKGKVNLAATVENRLAAPATLAVLGTVRDWYGASQPFHSGPLALPAHGLVTYNVPFSLARPNYSFIEAELLQGDQSISTVTTGVAVVPRPRNFGHDDPRSFFALQASGSGARAQRLGCKAVRVGRDWRYGEQGHGAYWFPDLSELRRNHQLIMFNMTAYPPRWALQQAEEATFWEAPGWEERVQWWGDYVEHCARALAAEVETFEIQNEPDLTCMQQVKLSFEAGVERYLRILRAGAAAVRRGAPGSLVAGIDVSGGDYDRGLPYSQALMGAAGDLLDVYTGHPYAGVRYFGDGQSPLWPVPNQERRKCQDTLAMIREHGGKQRFWVGEKGWGLDVKADPLSSHSRDFAACLVQSMALAHSVPGVERYFWFLEEGCNEHGYEYGLFRQGMPLPAALAYATLAYVLHHAAPVASPDLGPLVQAHCFACADTGQGVTVLWSEQQRSSVTLARLPADAVLLDMMGRETARGRAGKAFTLTVDRAPVYLTYPLKSAPRMAEVVTRATVANEQPVVLEAAFAADLRHLGARLRNVTREAQTATLSGPSGPQQMGLPAGESRLVLLPTSRPLDQTPGQDCAVTLKARRDVQRATVRVDLAPLAAVPPTALPAQGPPLPALDWWRGRPPLVLDQRAQVYPPDPTVGWQSPDDLNVRAWLGWDGQRLYLAALVHDPVHHVEADDPGRFWQSDSLQLALDPLNDAGTAPGFGADDCEFGLVLGAQGPRVVQTAPERRRLDSPVSIERQGANTIYRVALPWDLIGVSPEAGRVLGASFIVNQNNGQGRAYWMGLTPGIGEAKRPVAYRDLYLAP